jgi:16S rRNA (adenine1518-N6/adenine1519-N6)-dimethyltransferase
VSVQPKKELGQHWLVDENILGVVGRLAELARDDVVLEIGPGLGVLMAYLADRVGFVHGLELDRSLEPQLRERLADRPNVELAFGDALSHPLAELDPPPTKLVSNLPYNVATPIVVESLAGLPTVDRWCVMVQREVADRFFASPGTKDYGAVSIVVQLAAERTGSHPVARTCFRPPPNVDSTLVAFRRRRAWAEDLDAARRVAQAAFAHRRKTLLNSLELAGFDRARAASALDQMGISRDVRAEALSPEELLRLAERVA